MCIRDSLTPAIKPLPRAIRLRAANGSVVPLDGHIYLYIKAGAKLIRADALVTSHVKEKLFLSWHDLRELAIIPKDFPLSSCAHLSLLDSDPSISGSPASRLFGIGYALVQRDKDDKLFLCLVCCTDACH